MKFEIPILLIVFNRPDKTKKMLEILKNLKPKIFLFQQMVQDTIINMIWFCAKKLDN